MNRFEQLSAKAHDEGIILDRGQIIDGLSGMMLSVEGCPPIAYVSPALNQAESACILAEELGHYYTSVGNNAIDADRRVIDRAETRAVRSAVRDVMQLHPDQIISLIMSGVSSFHDLAEALEITEHFLNRARIAWIAEYGLAYRRDGYTLAFDPLTLQIDLWASDDLEQIDECKTLIKNKLLTSY